MSALLSPELVINNAAALRYFAFSLTRDDENAKDLLQETLYRALANREKFNAGTNIKAWMYTIMRNIFINEFRRKSKRKLQLMDNDMLVNHTTSIENFAHGNLKLGELQLAIHHLPAIFRHPFVMYFEGYQYHEISVMLNEPLGTIKSRIHFARKLLKEKISRHG